MEQRIKIFAVVFILTAISLNAQYHPEIKWREMIRGDIILIFPEGYEETARKTLDTAWDLYRELQELWKTIVKRKVRIILTDHTDNANGMATYFPLNLITIYLHEPPPDSYMGNARDWINLVLAHEMSHLFTFHMGSKFIRGLRKIFGSNPVLHPMTFAPLWMIEGLAIYGESISDRGGRLNTPDFFILLEQQKRDKTVPNWNRLFGQRTKWPGGNSPYLYGSTFLQYLQNEYRNKGIVDFALAYSKPLVILNFSYQYKKFYNEKLSILWNKFRESITPDDHEPSNIFQKSTRSGHHHRFPIAVAPGKLFTAVQNYQEYPGIFEWNLNTGKEKSRLKRARITGMTYFKEDQKIYFSATDNYKAFYDYSDIYQWDIRRKSPKRLSRGKRLSYPVRQGDKIFCIQRRKSKSFLCQLDIKTNQAEILSDGYDAMAFVSISPDGTQMAASVKTRGRQWEIGIFERTGHLKKILSHPEGKLYHPIWRTNSDLYFISQTATSYRLALYRSGHHHCRIQDSPHLPPIQYFNWTHEDQNLIVSYFTSNGYDLGILPASKLSFVPTPDIMIRESTNHAESADSHDDRSGIRKYRFLRDLIPQYFSPYGRISQDRFQPGILLSGQDALFKHAYWIEGFADTQNSHLNYFIDYTYNGIFPSLAISHSNQYKSYTNANRQAFDQQSREWQFRLTIPLKSRNHYRLFGFAALHLEQQTRTDTVDDMDISTSNHNGIRIGIVFNSAKTYWDSISRSDGTFLNIGFQRDMRELGSNGNSNRAFFLCNHYVPLFRPGVLAFRFAFSDSWGEFPYPSPMGGAQSNDNYTTTGGGLFDLMRGYPEYHFSGTGGALINIEYRLPLFKIEKAWLLGCSLERVYITLFSDLGNMWHSKMTWDPAVSYGAELSLVVHFGFQFTFTGGVAWSHNPTLDPTFYFRIGKSF